jgi:carbon-monoxide dehydrogenase small subunit
MPESTVRLQFRVNDTTVQVEAHPMARLLDVLRTQLHLTGAKEGCGEGECGACAILIDGRLVNSCLVPAMHADGCTLLTIEGMASSGSLHPLQQAFIEKGGAQCGICTPGMVLAAASLRERHPTPTLEQMRAGLSGNLCRCTGYMRIFESVVASMRGPA